MKSNSPLMNSVKISITRMVYTSTSDSKSEARGTVKSSWVAGEILDVLKTNLVTNETLDVGQDSAYRTVMLRYFGDVVISELDQILIDGETFLIDGIPKTSSAFSGQERTMTTIVCTKLGVV